MFFVVKNNVIDCCPNDKDSIFDYYFSNDCHAYGFFSRDDAYKDYIENIEKSNIEQKALFAKSEESLEDFEECWGDLHREPSDKGFDNLYCNSGVKIERELVGISLSSCGADETVSDIEPFLEERDDGYLCEDLGVLFLDDKSSKLPERGEVINYDLCVDKVYSFLDVKSDKT